MNSLNFIKLVGISRVGVVTSGLSVTVLYPSSFLDGANIRIYVDGVLDKEEARSSGNPLETSTDTMFIGKYTGDTNHYFGTIDEVRISDVARDAGWISTEYSNQNSPDTFYSMGNEETAP